MNDPKERQFVSGAPAKAGRGNHLFELDKLNPYSIGPSYTDAKGTVVAGERMIIGLVRLPASSITDRHHHPNEQWMYIIQGSFHAEIDGEHVVANAGSALYIPPGVPHGGHAGAEGDLVFFTVKDASWGIEGHRST